MVTLGEEAQSADVPGPDDFDRYLKWNSFMVWAAGGSNLHQALTRFP
jgi:hypothetical protein